MISSCPGLPCLRRVVAACEIRCKPAAGALLLALLLTAAPPPVLGQEPAPAPADAAYGQPPGQTGPSRPADAAEVADEHAVSEDEAHGESPWALTGRIFNFALLAGTLIYLLRNPLARYLTGRREQVRADLDAAEQMKRAAAAQMSEMDARLAALPGELETLKARGREEIAAEEDRIRTLAERERVRLLEQARRDLDQRVRLAERELVEHAAALAIGVAEGKIRRQITDEDQARLVDRYLTQVKVDD